jgi:hypothetical protein
MNDKEAATILLGAAPHPVIYLLFSFIFSNAVALLNFTHELLTVTFNHVVIVISEFTSLFLHVTFYLLPFTLNLIPIHSVLLSQD